MNVADLVAGAAEDYPAKDALIFQGRSISFAEVDELVGLAAAALADLGVGTGDRVALLAGNVPEFVYALYGILRAGGVACPLNVMLTPEEISYILADAGAKVAIVDLASLPGLLSIRDRLNDLQTVVVIGGPPAPSRTVSFEEILSTEAELPGADLLSDDLAVIAYTAGTTAAPKGVVLTHGNLVANLDQMMSVPALAEAEEDVALLALPLFHIYAMNVILGLGIRTGAAAVLVERFD
ncbi:MAG: AMP-binding protein, partial [Actinomycetota bacterium]